MIERADIAGYREFFLYWVGFVVVVASTIAVLMAISGLLVDVLSYRCWYPIISPLLGVSQPPSSTQIENMPFYCANHAVRLQHAWVTDCWGQAST